MLRRQRRPEPVSAVPVRKLRARTSLAETPNLVQQVLAHAAGKPRRTTSADSAAERMRIAAQAKKAIELNLNLIANADAAIDDAVARREQACKIIEAQLKLAGLEFHSDGSYLAQIKEQWSNQSTTIDPKKFKAKVPNDVFWACIDVRIGKAKQMLSTKEFNEVTSVTAGTLLGRRLEVKKMEPKKRTPRG